MGQQHLMAVVVVRAGDAGPDDVDGWRGGLTGPLGERAGTYDGRVIAALSGRLVLEFPDPRSAVAFVAAVQPTLTGATAAAGIDFGDAAAVEQLRGGAYEVADHLAGRATAGEVLVSDVVRRLCGPLPGLRFVDRGRARLTTAADPWQLHAVVPSGESPASATFGRDEELARLTSLIQSVRGGSGGAVLLEGEAGIGKSHLVRAASSVAGAEGVTVAVGRADELEQDRPGRVLTEMAQQLGVADGELFGPEALRDGTDPAYVIVERFTDAVEHRSAQGPVLLVAEDLHWGDDLSLRALATLVRRLAPLPVGVVATTRPAPRPTALVGLMEVLDRAGWSTIRLDGLDDGAVAGIVAVLTGATPGPRLRAHLAAVSGNPLFVTELLAALDDSGAVRVVGGMAETSLEDVPDGLLQTLQRRVERLPGDTTEALRAASLLGSGFSLDDLAVVVGRSVVEVAAAVRPALDAALVHGEGQHLAFRHDLVREAVYRSVPEAMRADLHLSAGRALAVRGVPADRVARQFGLGARPGDTEAAGWLLRAARAAARVDTAAAVRWYEQALAMAPPDWPDRVQVEASLIELLAWSGRVGDARELAGALLDRSRSSDDRLRAHRALASVLNTVGDVAGAVAQLESALELPDVGGGERAVLECAVAGMSVIAGTGRATEAAGVGHEHVDDPDPVVACWARNTLAVASVAQAAYDDQVEHSRVACALLETAHVPPLGFLIPQAWLPTGLFNLDDFAGAREAADAAQRHGEEHGDVGLIAHATTLLAGLDWLSGCWDEATTRVETGFTLVEDTGVDVHVVMFHAVAALIALGRGDETEAEHHLGAGERIFAAGDVHPFGVDMLLWARAQLAERSGDDEQAVALLEVVWEQTRALRGLVQWRVLGPDLVRLLHARGDTERAAAVSADVRALAGSSSCSADAAAMRTEARVHGDPALSTRAVELLRRTPRVVELALACEDGADLLAGDGDGDAAVALLEEAAALHDAMGAAAARNRIDARLRALGVRRRRGSSVAPATHGWDALSPKEREVVQLVAAGLSNPQIAERLYISRRTVETHLSHVFRKLDLRNRTQLAAAVVERGTPPD